MAAAAGLAEGVGIVAARPPRTAVLWAIVLAHHTRAIREEPAAYERRVTAFFEESLSPRV